MRNMAYVATLHRWLIARDNCNAHGNQCEHPKKTNHIAKKSRGEGTRQQKSNQSCNNARGAQ